MKSSFFGAGLICCGLFSLLSACASTPDADSGAGKQTVASADCETIPPSTGSNMTRRSCKPAAGAKADKPATAQ